MEEKPKLYQKPPEELSSGTRAMLEEAYDRDGGQYIAEMAKAGVPVISTPDMYRGRCR